MNPRHTPLPWKLSPGHNGLRSYSDETHYETTALVARVGNAEFIHRAVNSHYELLEAIQAILDSTRSVRPPEDVAVVSSSSLMAARAAIAKATL